MNLLPKLARWLRPGARIFLAEPMPRTPFAGVGFGRVRRRRFFAAHGLYFVDEPALADLVVSGRLRNLLPYIRRYGTARRYFLWSREPRINPYFDRTISSDAIIAALGQEVTPSFRDAAPAVQVMNVYTRDVYVDNYYHFPPKRVFFPKRVGPCTVTDIGNRTVVTLMTHRRAVPILQNGRDLDLMGLRQSIALAGRSRGSLDIFGASWQDGISLEDSRAGQWHKRKREILSKYRFNLCFENVNFDYYCTEKIWDSIEGGCLPIYLGDGNRIYEDFPHGSFLDYAELGSPAALFDYIQRMTVDEFRVRMNRCIEAYQAVGEKVARLGGHRAILEAMLLRTVGRVQDVLAGTIPDDRSRRHG